MCAQQLGVMCVQGQLVPQVLPVCCALPSMPLYANHADSCPASYAAPFPPPPLSSPPPRLASNRTACATP
jgi:hypothetical protein